MGLYVGLDIGGTKFIAAACRRDGAILRRIREKTPLDLDEGLTLLSRMVEEVAGGEAVAAMGAAIGGPLDWQTGVVSPLHQPRWRNVPLKIIMEEIWRCPFYVDVDTNIAALGEYRFGGSAAARLLYVTVSTGMGGGFLVDGRIYRGMNGGHPEAGHQSINFRCSNPGAIECECGAPDCLEALVSGNGIRRIYGKPAEDLNEGEWDEVGYNLGQGLRNMAAVMLPDVIVLGGSVAVGGGDRLLAAARDVMRDCLKIVPAPELRISALGGDTALMGALSAAMDGF